MKRALIFPVLGLALAQLVSCVKVDETANLAPETQMSIDEIKLSGDNRLNSTVNLSWFGSDQDGYIVGYELSFDNNTWFFTDKQDSTFTFALPEGSDTTDIDFYARAIDNEENRDPTPAYLKVPLKNTPPVAEFYADWSPRDTALAVATFYWTVNDADGIESITKVEIKANDGNWTEINRSENLISFVIQPSSAAETGTAQIYYGESDAPESITLDGIRINDTNRFYVRASDLANATSDADTSNLIFFRAKSPSANTLWISGHTSSTTPEYKALLDAAGVEYDLLDFGANIDGSNIPAYWDPTVKLTARQYKSLFINSESTTFTNTVTGEVNTILNFIAPVIQDFTNNGGKYMVTTAFGKDDDLTRLIGPFPVDSLVVNGGNAQARIVPDSLLLPEPNFSSYPTVSPESTQRDIVPIYPSSDAEAFYAAQLTKLNNWEGPNVVAAVRRPNGILTEVFFALELHNYNLYPQDLENLFKKILIDEFN